MTNAHIQCIYKVSPTQILVSAQNQGVKIFNLTLNGNYSITEKPETHYL